MSHILEIVYLIGSISFVLGLKMMGQPDTARKGNAVAAFGMGVSVLGTLFIGETGFSVIPHIGLILSAISLGVVVGTVMAKRVQMTAMPEMVSLFNGMGGLCAALISMIEWRALSGTGELQGLGFAHYLPVIAGLIIGTVSFVGSMVAWGKLNGSLGDFRFKGQQFINMMVLLAILVASGLTFVFLGADLSIMGFFGTLALSVVYGLLFVFPIGGADMPVVISLLNSFTGVAAACGGFLYHNNVMLMGGVLVGSAGTILTIVMCQAMNRSLTNVLIGAVGNSSSSGSGSSGGKGGSVREVQATDVAIMMKYASKVVIVPGYGLAVAQAQHVCHELESLLESEGVDVKYAIHPVAGRMPGHMNVLLAESNVSYDKLVEMEHINPEFGTTDTVLIVGANDVVNPAAKTDPASPIYGMPILDVDQSKQIVVLKRSMKSGYAGIDNELFFNPKCGMLFGDAKDSLQKLVNEIKAL
ncbi:MAG: NAD(P)(+) transhydrogenase (Re/Si-specific) subunit beta [Bdellovibrionales bacterium]|nr:NAD(P)(+) transhydrogenase (Re/Si-specific) subunit beta [Bdellovibrionales bacterium]